MFDAWRPDQLVDGLDAVANVLPTGSRRVLWDDTAAWICFGLTNKSIASTYSLDDFAAMVFDAQLLEPETTIALLRDEPHSSAFRVSVGNILGSIPTIGRDTREPQRLVFGETLADGVDWRYERIDSR